LPTTRADRGPADAGALDMTLLKLIESRPLNDDAIRLRYQVLRGRG
jgi:hypothetical protein